jgi:hypothetical protein
MGHLDYKRKYFLCICMLGSGCTNDLSEKRNQSFEVFVSKFLIVSRWNEYCYSFLGCYFGKNNFLLCVDCHSYIPPSLV